MPVIAGSHRFVEGGKEGERLINFLPRPRVDRVERNILTIIPHDSAVNPRARFSMYGNRTRTKSRSENRNRGRGTFARYFAASAIKPRPSSSPRRVGIGIYRNVIDLCLP